MNGHNRVLEIAENQMGEKKMSGVVKNVFNDSLYVQFYLKNHEKVYYDPKHQVIKMLFE